jgi:hypothetical protein
MTEQPRSLAEQDTMIARVGEVSLRMMAGAIAPGRLRALEHTVRRSTANYPWQEVVDLVLDDPMDASDLVNRGLRAQRDWIARGGRPPGGERRRARAATRLKTWLAFALVRGFFYALLAVAFVLVLLLLKAGWPEIDIYRVLDWLRDALPGLFGAR